MASREVTAATAALACQCRRRATDGRGCAATRCPGRHERSCRRRSGAIPSERKKELSFLIAHVTGKMLRRDADHDMRDAIQRERLSDDVRIGAQLVLPVAVSQNHDGFSCQRVIPGRVESGASRQRHAERLEVVRRRRTSSPQTPSPSCWRLDSRSGSLRLSSRSAPSRYWRRAGSRNPDRTTCSPASREPRGVVTSSTRPSVFTPAGGILQYARQYGIAMTGTMPIPSDTTHTNVNARAFASDRPAYTRSRQMPLNISGFNHRELCLAKQFVSAGLIRAFRVLSAVQLGTRRGRNVTRQLARPSSSPVGARADVDSPRMLAASITVSEFHGFPEVADGSPCSGESDPSSQACRSRGNLSAFAPLTARRFGETSRHSAPEFSVRGGGWLAVSGRSDLARPAPRAESRRTRGRSCGRWRCTGRPRSSAASTPAGSWRSPRRPARSGT